MIELNGPWNWLCLCPIHIPLALVESKSVVRNSVKDKSQSTILDFLAVKSGRNQNALTFSKQEKILQDICIRIPYISGLLLKHSIRLFTCTLRHVSIGSSCTEMSHVSPYFPLTYSRNVVFPAPILPSTCIYAGIYKSIIVWFRKCPINNQIRISKSIPVFYFVCSFL